MSKINLQIQGPTKLFFFLLSMTLLSCEGQNTFREDIIFAGNLYVKADHLNLGKRIYTEYCMACHGVEGKGDGPASKGLYPPPRNFTLGIIKFGDTLSGELPHDEILKYHLKQGLNGTAMLPWDLSEHQSDAVIQYIKTFAPEVWIGKDKTLGTKVRPTRDPFGLARKNSAIERGKAVYHVSANCQACHQAYISKEELALLSNRIEETDDYSADDFDNDIYALKLQESEHGHKIIPPDFTWHQMRSIHSMEDLYLRIAAGIGGTTMPPWRDSISDEDIWAVSYYIQSLADLKDQSQKRSELRTMIKREKTLK